MASNPDPPQFARRRAARPGGRAERRALLACASAILIGLAGCGGDGSGEGDGPPRESADPGAAETSPAPPATAPPTATPSVPDASGRSPAEAPSGPTPLSDPATDSLPRFSYAGPVLEDLPPAPEGDSLVQVSERDWAIARGTLAWAWEQGLQVLPIGDVVATIGTTFVGTPYIPGTLELPGPERLVVNLRQFDCVTFVEHVLVLARLTRSESPGLLDDEGGFRDRYRDELTRVRYRDGVLAGYPSRLHYFSEWIRNAQEKGLVRDVTAELGGIEDPRPIDFMSSNPDAYRQLSEEPGLVDTIRVTEERLTATPRHFIPEDRIASIEEGIRNGDLIAAVSSVDGLDVAHTGIALWHGGRLHLMHAPLVGDSVEISERPLADRIRTISGQTGIIVARPVSPR